MSSDDLPEGVGTGDALLATTPTMHTIAENSHDFSIQCLNMA
jgi:hypothetical protein